MIARFLLALMAVTFITSTAWARGIVSEVQYYTDIEVLFSESAAKCGFKDAEDFKAPIAERLSSLDVPQNPDARTRVILNITSKASGLLDQRCVAFMDLQLQADLAAEFVDATAIQSNDEIFSIASERGYVFPVIFYQTGALLNELAPSMHEEALKALDILLNNLADARKLR